MWLWTEREREREGEREIEIEGWLDEERRQCGSCFKY